MRYASFHIIAAAVSGILAACNQMGDAKVRPVVKVGPPAAALKTAEDEARVAALIPQDGVYANSVSSISLHVSGACISDSVGVLVKVPSAGTSLTLFCDPSTNEFSGEIDLSGLPDGLVQIQFGFLKSLESELPVYELTRTVTKDTESLPAFTLPSPLTDSGGVIAVDPVDGAVLYRATFTPQSGGGPTVTVEETSPSIPVASLTVGTTYSLSFAAIDGAGNETVASNTPTFTRLFTIKAQLVSLPPGIASPVQFYRFTGPWTSNCTDGFVSCNPNMNVTIGRTTISVGVGQTVTVGSGLTTSDMYYFSIVGGQRIDCVADTGSPALWEYVTGSATIKVVCNLDPPNPVSLAAAATSSTQVDLSWTSGGGFTMGYRIAYKSGATAPNDCSTAGTGITLVGEGSITGTSYSVTGAS
ncbi:hypothetical protein EBZ80_15125 [bacterium]|nr:hypothetical protein [bacterium]